MGDHVFVCYSRKDEDFVLKLASNLKSRGVPIWLDKWDIPTGANWNRTIEKALEESTHVLVILSPPSVASDEVQCEWLPAVDEKKAVIPIIYQPCQIPRQLKLIQYIDFTSSGPDDEGAIGQILSALGMAGTISIEPLTRQEKTQVKSHDQNAPIPNESTGPQEKIEKNNVIPYKKILIGIFLAIMIIAGLFIYTTINSSNTNLENENLLVSNYHDMYLNERNLFGASIALDDSVKEALYDLPTGNDIAPNGGINPTYGNENNVSISSTNELMSVGTRVDLTGPTFDITPANDLTSQAQDIPHNNPGQNLAKWRWWVIPREKGSHTLFIDAYTVDEKGHRTSINSTIRKIGVIVTSAPAAKVTTTKTTTVPAINQTTAKSTEKTPTPGFEGILAITGLMAVAYLVLGRKP